MYIVKKIGKIDALFVSEHCASFRTKKMARLEEGGREVFMLLRRTGPKITCSFFVFHVFLVRVFIIIYDREYRKPWYDC